MSVSLGCWRWFFCFWNVGQCLKELRNGVWESLRAGAKAFSNSSAEKISHELCQTAAGMDAHLSVVPWLTIAARGFER